MTGSSIAEHMPSLFVERPHEPEARQLSLLRPPYCRVLWHDHIPPAVQITRRNLVVMDGRVHHRFFDTTATPHMREFLLLEVELEDRAAAAVAWV